MKELIQHFPDQLMEAINISETYQWNPERTITNVVICGLGGSGIGGEIAKEWTKSIARIPIEVCHSYELPEYVSKTTLIISCSYSGNTEETLATLDEAFLKEALVVGITSGGKLAELLKEKNKLIWNNISFIFQIVKLSSRQVYTPVNTIKKQMALPCYN